MWFYRGLQWCGEVQGSLKGTQSTRSVPLENVGVPCERSAPRGDGSAGGLGGALGPHPCPPESPLSSFLFYSQREPQSHVTFTLNFLLWLLPPEGSFLRPWAFSIHWWLFPQHRHLEGAPSVE